MSFKLTTLGEYAKVQGGYAYRSTDFSESGYYRVLKIKNVRHSTVDYSETYFINEAIAKETIDWKTKEGDILISMTGSGPNAPQSLVGRVARIWSNEPEAWINQRVGKIVIKQENSIHPDFLFYLLSSDKSRNYLVSNSSGSANQANISGKIIESVPCPKVDYKKSAEIAKILRELDQKIIINIKINQTLEQIAQAIFKSWFVDFEPTRAKVIAKQKGGGEETQSLAAQAILCGAITLADIDTLSNESSSLQSALSNLIHAKLKVQNDDSHNNSWSAKKLISTAELFPNELVDSDLGNIPEGWSVCDLSEVSHLNQLSWTKRNAPNYISYVDLANTKNGVIESTQQFTWEEAPSRARRVLSKGDTIIGTVRPGNRSFAFIGELDKQLTASTGFAVLTPKKPEYIEFVYLLATSDKNIDRLTHLADGGAYPAVRPEVVTELNFVLAHDDLINVFSGLVSPIFKKRQINLEDNALLASLRDTLLPKLLNGILCY
ncbi:restriction endonuclease subunit S [Methylophaga sp.]|uniref:restriction endonuclease subunit S n=1 Tax=Methylophaga sp. TaxID=2024840 RepID=UPI003A94F695